jgi:CDP-diacylglycerol--glycerol-3-phosphate 3-phosphatidyltransferase
MELSRFTIPVGLTTVRLLLTPAVVALAAAGVTGWVWPVVLLAALLSDLFDGMAARRLGVDTPLVRRFDSATDVVFYLGVLAAVAILRRDVLVEYRWFFAAVLGLEVVCNLVSLAKNRTLPATHTYLAKGWAVLLAPSFAVVLGWGRPFPLLDLTLAYGIVVDLEVIAIILVTPGPSVDVPTVIHGLRRRRAARGRGGATPRGSWPGVPRGGLPPRRSPRCTPSWPTSTGFASSASSPWSWRCGSWPAG